VTAPLVQVLGATATFARPQNAPDFVLNGAFRKVNRGRSGRKSVIRVRAVRPQVTRVKGVMDIAVHDGLGNIKAKHDAIDALRHAIGTGPLGHLLLGALVSVRHQVLGAEVHKVSNDDGAWTSTAIGVVRSRVICRGNAVCGVSLSFR